MKHRGQLVHYLGLPIYITMPFVATNAEGVVEQFHYKPSYDGDWLVWEELSGGYFVCLADLEDTDWKTTMRDYSHVIKEEEYSE